MKKRKPTELFLLYMRVLQKDKDMRMESYLIMTKDEGPMFKEFG
jgi:hypothetical protein